MTANRCSISCQSSAASSSKTSSWKDIWSEGRFRRSGTSASSPHALNSLRRWMRKSRSSGVVTTALISCSAAIWCGVTRDGAGAATGLDVQVVRRLDQTHERLEALGAFPHDVDFPAATLSSTHTRLCDSAHVIALSTMWCPCGWTRHTADSSSSTPRTVCRPVTHASRE